MNQSTLFGVEHLQSGDDLDFYVTPRNAFEALLEVLPKPKEGWAIFEPAAGSGTLLGWALELLNVRAAWANELNPGRYQRLCERLLSELVGGSIPLDATNADFLAADFLEPEHWDSSGIQIVPGRRLVLMNPPYSKPRKTIAMEFVEKALCITPPDGMVAAMLPLAFAETRDRAFRIHNRWDGSMYPLVFRPDCGGDYGSGSRAFAWFVWDLMNPRREWRPIG